MLDIEKLLPTVAFTFSFFCFMIALTQNQINLIFLACSVCTLLILIAVMCVEIDERKRYKSMWGDDD